MWITILTYGIATMMYAAIERGIRRLYFSRKGCKVTSSLLDQMVSSPRILAITPIYHLWMLAVFIITVVVRIIIERSDNIVTYSYIELGVECAALFVYFGKPELSIPVNRMIVLKHISRCIVVGFTGIYGLPLPMRSIISNVVLHILSVMNNVKNTTPRSKAWKYIKWLSSINDMLYVSYVFTRLSVGTFAIARYVQPVYMMSVMMLMYSA